MIFFSSDQHFYHSNVIKYCERPFSSVEEMNEAIVERWNEVVSPEDTIYVLGDFSLARRPVELFVPRLNGTKHLIAGNHDQCHPVISKTPTKLTNSHKFYIDNGFASIALEGTVKIAGQTVLMHHMPYAGDHGEERYQKWRLKDQGQWLLHGHVHTVFKQREKMINVGVDVWNFYPVPIDTIADLIKAGPV